MKSVCAKFRKSKPKDTPTEEGLLLSQDRSPLNSPLSPNKDYKDASPISSSRHLNFLNRFSDKINDINQVSTLFSKTFRELLNRDQSEPMKTNPIPLTTSDFINDVLLEKPNRSFLENKQDKMTKFKVRPSEIYKDFRKKLNQDPFLPLVKDYLSTNTFPILESNCLIDLSNKHRSDISVMILIKDDIIVTAGVDLTIRGWKGNLQKFVFRGHGDIINDLAVNWKEDLLFSVSKDRSLRMWDLEAEWNFMSWKAMICCNDEQLGEEPKIVRTFGEDCVVTSADDGKLAIWKANKKSKTITFYKVAKIKDIFTCVIFEELSLRVGFVGTKTGAIRVFSIDKQEFLEDETPCDGEHLREICCMDIDLEKKLLVSASEDEIKLWEITKKSSSFLNLIAVFPEQESAVKKICFMKNKDKLIFLDQDGILKVWSIQDLKKPKENKITKQIKSVHNFLISKDKDVGKIYSFMVDSIEEITLDSENKDGEINLTDDAVIEYRLNHQRTITLEKSNQGKNNVNIEINPMNSPGGKLEQSKDPNKQFLKIKTMIPTESMNMRCMAFSSNETKRLAFAIEEKLYIYDMRLKLTELVFFKRSQSPINSLAYSPDDSSLAVGRIDGSITIYPENMKFIQNLELNYHKTLLITKNQRLLFGSKENSIEIYNISGKSLEAQLEGNHFRNVSCLGSTDNFIQIFAGFDDGVIMGWEFSTRKKILFLQSSNTPIRFIGTTFKNDLVFMTEREVFRWDIKGGSKIESPGDFGNFIPGDCEFLARESHDKLRIEVIRVTNAKTVALLEKDRDCDLKVVSISNDSNTFAAIFSNNLVRVWKLKKNKYLTGNQAHSLPILFLGVTGDQKLQLISVSTSLELKNWDVDWDREDEYQKSLTKKETFQERPNKKTFNMNSPKFFHESMKKKNHETSRNEPDQMKQIFIMNEEENKNFATELAKSIPYHEVLTHPKISNKIPTDNNIKNKGNSLLQIDELSVPSESDIKSFPFFEPNHEEKKENRNKAKKIPTNLNRDDLEIIEEKSEYEMPENSIPLENVSQVKIKNKQLKRNLSLQASEKPLCFRRMRKVQKPKTKEFWMDYKHIRVTNSKRLVMARGNVLEIFMLSNLEAPIKKINAHNNNITGLEIIEDSSILTASKDDKKIKFWKLEGLELFYEFDDCPIDSISINSDNNLMIFSFEKQIQLWDYSPIFMKKKPILLSEYKFDWTDSIKLLKIDQYCSRLACACYFEDMRKKKCQIVVWNIPDWQEEKIIEMDDGDEVLDMVFLPLDYNLLLISSLSKQLQIIYLGAVRKENTQVKYPRALRQFIIVESKDLFIASDDEGNLEGFSLYVLVKMQKLYKTCIFSNVSIEQFIQSKDKSKFLTVSKNNIIVWDAKTKKIKKALVEPDLSVVLLSDLGDLIITGSKKGTINCYETSLFNRVHQYQCVRDDAKQAELHIKNLSLLRFENNANLKIIGIVYLDGKISLFDVNQGHELKDVAPSKQGKDNLILHSKYESSRIFIFSKLSYIVESFDLNIPPMIGKNSLKTHATVNSNNQKCGFMKTVIQGDPIDCFTTCILIKNQKSKLNLVTGSQRGILKFWQEMVKEKNGKEETSKIDESVELKGFHSTEIIYLEWLGEKDDKYDSLLISQDKALNLIIWNVKHAICCCKFMVSNSCLNKKATILESKSKNLFFTGREILDLETMQLTSNWGPEKMRFADFFCNEANDVFLMERNDKNEKKIHVTQFAGRFELSESFLALKDYMQAKEYETACLKNLTMFPFGFNYLHLFAIFENFIDIDGNIIEPKISKNFEIALQAFVMSDFRGKTCFEILLENNQKSQIKKLMNYLFSYLSKDQEQDGENIQDFWLKLKFFENKREFILGILDLFQEDTDIFIKLLNHCFVPMENSQFCSGMVKLDLEKPVFIAHKSLYWLKNDSVVKTKIEKRVQDEGKFQRIINFLPRFFKKDQKRNETKSEVLCNVFLIKDLSKIDEVTLGIWEKLLNMDPSNKVFDNKVLGALIRYKWDAYARRFYMHECLWFLFFFAIYLTNFIYIYPVRKTQDHLIRLDVAIVSGVLEIIDFVFVIYYLIRQIKQMKQGLSKFFYNVWNVVDMLVVFGTFTSLLMDLLQVVIQRQYFHETKMLIAQNLLCLWVKLLSYTRGFQGTGFLVRLVEQVIIDMRFFVFIIFLVLLAFTSAGFITQFGYENGQFYVFNLFYRLMLGDYTIYDEFVDPKDPLPLWILMILFTLFLTIIMLNLLISVIGSTYDKVFSAQYSMRNFELLYVISEIENEKIMNRKEATILEDQNVIGDYLICFHNPSHFENDEEGETKILKELKDLDSKIQTVQRKVDEKGKENVENCKKIEEKFQEIERKIEENSKINQQILDGINHIQKNLHKESQANFEQD